MYMSRGGQNDCANGRQGVVRGTPGGRHPCVTPKIYHRRPKSPPTELILEPLDANFAAQVLIFDNLAVNFMFFDRFFTILINLEQIFKCFSLPRPRFLQYLTVNLKVFACCSESLRERFRSAQNAPKMPPSGLPDPFGGL